MKCQHTSIYIIQWTDPMHFHDDISTGSNVTKNLMMTWIDTGNPVGLLKNGSMNIEKVNKSNEYSKFLLWRCKTWVQTEIDWQRWKCCVTRRNIFTLLNDPNDVHIYMKLEWQTQNFASCSKTGYKGILSPFQDGKFTYMHQVRGENWEPGTFEFYVESKSLSERLQWLQKIDSGQSPIMKIFTTPLLSSTVVQIYKAYLLTLKHGLRSVLLEAWTKK